MEFVEIPYDSDDYRAALELRNKVLRLPIGRSVYDEDLEREHGEWHFGLKAGSDLVACLVIRPDGPGRVRLRQMVVAADRRGSGLGRQLVEQVEQILLARGIREVYLHARVEAEGFYARLGYRRVGEEFVELGIRHVEMTKEIVAS
jgi:predicted GNAT family N-acyltransferase